MDEFVYPDTPRAEIVPLVPEWVHSVLDVGCSSGAFGRHLKDVRPNVRVEGIEPDPRTATIAKGRLDRVYVGVFPDMLPVGQRYDCVVFNDVLEHVVDPAPLLKAALSVLHPHGVLVASIPNVRYGPVVLDLVARGRWEYQDQGVLDRTHLRFYTRRSMRRTLEETGWAVQQVRRLNVPGSRRAPWLAKMIEASLRDLSCPQIGLTARPAS